MEVTKPGHFVLSEEDVANLDKGGSWAQVELFRHEYGELPKPNDKRQIHLDRAFRAAGKACLEKKLDPFNAATMLSYAGKLLEGKVL